MQKEGDDGTDSFLVKSERVISSLSPRLILLEENGNIPLVPYKDTGWLGLPGGKATEAELVEEVNFLSTGAFPTLAREVWEECGIDVSYQLERSACLGLAEIGVVDSVQKQVNFVLTPIYVCKTNELRDLDENVQVVNIWQHIPGPLFPDARLAISRLKEGVGNQKGQIHPGWLNGNKIYFEMKPQMGLLMGPPEWMR